MRPDEKVHRSRIEHNLRRVVSGLDWLETQIATTAETRQMTQALVGTGVGCEFLRIALPEHLEHDTYPRLKGLSRIIGEHPAFEGTRPEPDQWKERIDMTKPCIICVAITGSVPRKKDNPAVPISISEQVESTQEAFEAGAVIAHCHVRNDDETPSSDPEKFARLQEGLKTHCPGMIVQFSTGGRSGNGRERGQMLSLRPDMASLTTGSNNFPNRVYENDPELIDWLAGKMRIYGIKPEIEAFDLGHIFKAVEMQQDGSIPGNLYIQFVMGVKNAMPVDREVFDFYVETVERLSPASEWCAAGIGAGQMQVNEWCVAAGGHCRTGLEDNVRLDRNTLAASNAALVSRVVALCEQNDRSVATATEARGILEIGTPET